MIDHSASGTIPLPLDPEQLADVLLEHTSDIELGDERGDGYRVIECTVQHTDNGTVSDDDPEVRLSLIVAPSLGIISLTFYSTIQADVDLVHLLQFLRRLCARGPQYNIAFHDQRVAGISFDHELRVVPGMPVAVLVDTLTWFAKYVAIWHSRLHPHAFDTDEDEEEDELFDDIELDDDDVDLDLDDDDDDDDDDGRYVVRDVEFTL